MTVEHCTSNLMNALTDPKHKGSASSNSDEQSADAFRDIPFDIKDRVLNLIDSPRDLLALSLTSQEWSAMIIPLHIRYRELRIRANQPEIWQHLATRTDLSKNIRKVCLMASYDRRDQRLPLTLNEAETGIPPDGIHPQPEMIQALSHFDSLTSFTWLESGQHCQYTEKVFGALTNCRGLVELTLGMVCPRKDHLNLESSIWRIRNLRILVLKGHDWVSLGEAEYSFISMLNNSPALEELTIPYNYASVKFTSCRFRSLVKLHLSARSCNDTFVPGGDFPTTNNLIIDFLFAHPTIQDFSWNPPDETQISLPPGLLPTLKHLCTSHRLATALLGDDTLIKSRTLETLSQMYLDPDTVPLLGTINGSRLQEIHFWHCEGVETIRRVAGLFPKIKTIGILGYGPTSLDIRALHECIDGLGDFPLLENLYDSPLWFAIEAQNAENKEEIIRKLYTRCSALKTIYHWNFMTGSRREIAFFRDGHNVTWKEIVKDS